MEYINEVEKFVEKNFLSNVYILAIVKVSLTLYGAQIAPNPPEYLKKLLKNTYVKILLVSLIIYLGNKDLQLSILIAIIYILGMNVLSGRGALESFGDNIGSPYSSKYTPYNKNLVIIEPKNMIFPGCENVKMNDLINVFKGDNMQLQKTVQYSMKELMSKLKTKDARERLIKIATEAGLPYNVSFDNPESAPYIATILLNYNFHISDTCQPPR